MDSEPVINDATSACFGKISVSGPGQWVSIKGLAAGGMLAVRDGRCALLGINTINPLWVLRCFAFIIRCAVAAFKHPTIPGTVSCGTMPIWLFVSALHMLSMVIL